MSNFDNFTIHNGNNNVFFRPPMFKKDKDMSDPSQSQESPLKDPAQEEPKKAESDASRELVMQEIRRNPDFNRWYNATRGNAKEMAKLIEADWVSKGCNLPPELRQQGAQSVAYLLAGDCNPLQVMQLFASIQEELALANKKFANDQLQDAIKVTEEIRKMQLQAADKEKSTAITKAITSLLISGSGVVGGQIWTVRSNGLSRKI